MIKPNLLHTLAKPYDELSPRSKGRRLNNCISGIKCNALSKQGAIELIKDLADHFQLDIAGDRADPLRTIGKNAVNLMEAQENRLSKAEIRYALSLHLSPAEIAKYLKVTIPTAHKIKDRVLNNYSVTQLSPMRVSV